MKKKTSSIRKQEPVAVPCGVQRPTYHVFPRQFSAIECAELIGYAMSKPAQQATIGHGGRSVVDNMRRSEVRWLDTADLNLAATVARLRKLILTANARSFGVDYRDFFELQFTQYAAWNEGHYDWHQDCHFPRAGEAATPWDRRLSLVVQLSAPDSYAGGRLEMDPALPQDLFTQQGDVIVFPSEVRHRVTPVTAGVRWSLVTWAHGPRGG